MKVVKLRTENFMRLSAVEITPTGEVVKISGANGEGKSSTIDSIWAALCYSRLNISDPVHAGAKKAVIKLNLGEIKVERTITAKNNELKVTAADGVKVASPQKFLDGLIGELSFDPCEFEKMRPLEQFEQLRHLVKVDVDFADIAKKNEADFNRRTEVNRQAKAKRAQVDAMPVMPVSAPVDTKALLDQIQMAAASNAEIERRKAKRADAEKAAAGFEADVERITARIEQLRQEIVAADADRQRCEIEGKRLRERLAAAPPLPEPIDVSAVRAELDKAEAANAAATKGAERQRIEAEAAELEATSAQLTDAIDARNAAKETALAEAKMPVPGLSLGDGAVMYNGHPFHQASAAERLRISMAIAMAANPKLRVIRIANGSLLDSKSMAIVGQLARDNDYQVWVEVVDESKKVGIVIEDGAVVAVNQ